MLKTIIPILACAALSAVVAPSQSSAGGVPFENPVFRENAPDPTVQVNKAARANVEYIGTGNIDLHRRSGLMVLLR